MTKLIISFILLVSSALAQTVGTPVVPSDAVAYDPHTRYVFYSGSDTYVCTARAFQPESSVTYSSISNANVAVVTATAHGFHAESKPKVTITGGTGNWAAFNGTHDVTVIDANSFSVPVNTITFGAVTGTIVINSNAARTSQRVWAVQRSRANGSNQVTSAIWASVNGPHICDNRTSLNYQ